MVLGQLNAASLIRNKIIRVCSIVVIHHHLHAHMHALRGVQEKLRKNQGNKLTNCLKYGKYELLSISIGYMYTIITRYLRV